MNESAITRCSFRWGGTRTGSLIEDRFGGAGRIGAWVRGVRRNTLPGLGPHVRSCRRRGVLARPQHLEFRQLPPGQLLQDLGCGNADGHHAHRAACLPGGSERCGRTHAQCESEREGDQVRLERQLALDSPR
ncbi:hypothetical protein [Streptomyces mirabilis]|uniref:hypothetical protein n=1 Tax=Streptomyces mirabilis TaxID=68239 RepID=UPI0033A27365